jgi:hypothetical protein
LRVLLDGFKRGAATGRLNDGVALASKQDLEHLTQARLVFDD